MNVFNHQSIKSKIISISVIFTLLITFLVASFSYYTFNSLLSKSLHQSTSFNLHLASETIARDVIPITYLSLWAETNVQLSKYLEITDLMELHKKDYILNHTSAAKDAYDSTNQELRVQSLSSWKRLLEEYRNNRSSIYLNRIVVGSDNNNFLQVSPISSYHVLNISETIRSMSFFETQISSEKLLWTGLETSPLNDQNNMLSLPIIRPVYAAYKNNIIGWVYLDISSSIITDAFKSYNLPDDSRLFMSIHDKTYEIKNNKLVPILDTSTLENASQSVSVASSLDGWSFTQTLSTKEFNEQRRVYFQLLLFISFIVLCLGLGLTYLLNQKINKPLNKLLSKMNLISKGDFSKDSSIEWENEMGSIGRGINNMSKDIVALMDKKVEDEKQKNDLEYQILQSQINPHFLYNTLNSIKWMATIQNATGISEMTTALSKLLRSVSKDTQQIHPLKEEIALLDHYFLIQKYRYGGALFLNYKIADEDLLSCLVPKFSLQPIVENAIFHGIEPKGEVGYINVIISEESTGLLIIKIEDNGIGMTQDQIQEVLTSPQSNPNDFFKKIGINNVNMRIKHSYGPDYGLSIESTQNKGTTMTIRLPQKRRNP